jgi:hypothetical protein
VRGTLYPAQQWARQRPAAAQPLDPIFSYPGYDFDRLRREAPGQYESYVDLEVGEWTHLRIEVAGAQARLYVGGATQPALIVNDLKRGAEAHGTVGLFVGIGADGHFRNLSVRPR